jgi:proteasome lid subunit RPN8/RPN11
MNQKIKKNKERLRKKLPLLKPRLPDKSVLRFSPNAWAKLHYFCHAGNTEIGGFGVASDPNDLLRIDDFITVKQATSCVSVAFEDLSVADYFELQVDMGNTPEQFARIWLHTHPGDSPHPSATDEETFSRVFGKCDWAVMFILARGGQIYCRLRFNSGPGGQIVLPVKVDYEEPFGGSDHAAWKAEFESNIHPEANHLGVSVFDLVIDPKDDPFSLGNTDQLLDVVDERGQIELLMEEHRVDNEAELQALLGDVEEVAG